MLFGHGTAKHFCAADFSPRARWFQAMSILSSSELREFRQDGRLCVHAAGEHGMLWSSRLPSSNTQRAVSWGDPLENEERRNAPPQAGRFLALTTPRGSLKESSSLSTKPKMPGGIPPSASAKGSSEEAFRHASSFCAFSAWMLRSQKTASTPTWMPFNLRLQVHL